MAEKMKAILIIVGIIVLFVGAGLAVLSHPAFGLWRHVSKERILASPNYRDGMFRSQIQHPPFGYPHRSSSTILIKQKEIKSDKNQ